MTSFERSILRGETRIVLPIATYPGAQLTGATVKDIVTHTEVQCEVLVALHERYATDIILTCMDLSVEAEAFGSSVHFSDREIPTVRGRRITDVKSIGDLEVPSPGEKRTVIYLDVATQLKKLPSRPPVFGGMIGPFTLAGRLFGVSELLELTIEDPGNADLLIEKTTRFLMGYAAGFKETGIDGIIIAEPAAGLLSPTSLLIFSSQYIQQIQMEVGDDSFTLVLHNCGARKNHLESTLQSTLSFFHFGAPMDMLHALSKVEPTALIAGSLDPAAVFLGFTPDTVHETTLDLLRLTQGFKNFIVSSGCDIPPNVSLESLDAF